MERGKTTSILIEKKCRTCHKILPISNFRLRKRNKDGYSWVCSKCSRPYKKRYYEENRDAKKGYNTKYREKNREKLNANLRVKASELRATVLRRIAEAAKSFMPYCFRCGFTDLRALQIDHIGGGGTQILDRITTYRYYRNILDMSLADVKKQYQLLCANCNMIKKEENRENYLWKKVSP